MTVLLMVGSGDVGASPTGGTDTLPEIGDSGLDPALQDADGEIEVIVRFDTVMEPGDSGANVDADALARTASKKQAAFEEFALTTDAVTVKRQFAVANAALVTIDTDEVPLERLLDIDGVDRIHENFEIQGPTVPDDDGNRSVRLASDADEAVWGVDRIGAPEVWEEFHTQGDGVAIAVLDTGVDADHPDVDLDAERWAEFDEEGAMVESDPYDANGHGTRVTSVAAGGNASGTQIGVAPEATLYHGGVATPEGGSAASLLAGLEWAVEQDVDVVSISLGLGGYEGDLIEPVRNAEAAGVVVVASTGNGANGSSASPANTYESIAVGSITPSGDVRNDSGGQRIETAAAWSDPPSDWPDEYVVPDVVAPGDEIVAAEPGGGYVENFKKTSAAVPHVAGAVALLRSEDSGPSAAEVKDLLATTASKPASASSEIATSRYGHGVVDVHEAMERLRNDSVAVAGTVTDANGTPIEGAVVESETSATVTDGDGRYRMQVDPGGRTLTVSGFGIVSNRTAVNATGKLTERNIVAERTAAVEVVTDAPTAIEPGEAYDIEFRVANVDTHTVQSTERTIGNVTLEDGEIGVPADVSDVPRGEVVTVTVTSEPGDVGVVTLEHEFRGEDNESIEVRTTETAVSGDEITVGDDADLETVDDALAAATNGTTVTLLDSEYEIGTDENLTVTSSIRLTGNDTDDPELLFPKGAGSDAGINVTADGTTVSGIAIAGSVDTGLLVDKATDVQILANEVEATETGIAIGRNSSASLRRNEIEGGADVGLAVPGTASEISGNEVRTASTAVSVSGETDAVVDNRLEGPDAGLEVRQGGTIQALRNNTFTGNGTGVAILEGAVTEIAGNTFEGHVGIRAVNATTFSTRNDFSAVERSAISSRGHPTRSSLDYYGERGPRADDLDGNVTYGYFLTESPATLPSATEDLQNFGYHLEIGANETTAVSFPGPLANELETTFGEFNGTIYAYGTGTWEQVTSGDRRADALDAYVVTPEEDVRVFVEFENGRDTRAPTEVPLEAGWNFVGAPMTGGAERVYDATTTEPARIAQLYEAARGSPIDEPPADWTLYSFGDDPTGPNIVPHGGYFVYATDDGGLAANAYSGVTIGEFEEAVGTRDGSGLGISEPRREPDAAVRSGGD